MTTAPLRESSAAGAFRLEPRELAACAPLVQRAGRADALAALAAGPCQPLGELLVRAGRIAPDHLRGALCERAATGERLGEVLVRQGRLGTAERDVVLAFQRHQQGAPGSAEDLRLGRILLAVGDITPAQWQAALDGHRASGRALGEEVVARGHVAPERLARALHLQQWLVSLALALALAAAATGGALAAGGAANGTTRVQVGAQVMPRARLDAGRHPASVQVTARDVERGHVEVPAQTPYELHANVPFDVQVRLLAGWLQSATILGFAGALQAGPEGATLPHAPTVPGRLAGRLSYRFVLAPGVQPGSHDWPVALSVIVAP